MNIKVQTSVFDFVFTYEDRQLYCYLTIGSRTLINIDKEFSKQFKCVSCQIKVPDDEQTLRMCDSCKQDFARSWEERWLNQK